MPTKTQQEWDDARKRREAEPDNQNLVNAELEAELAHYRRVGVPVEKRDTFLGRIDPRYKRFFVYSLVVIAFAFTAWRLSVLSQENHSLTTNLQAAVIESCEENGNARAKVTREQLHEEINDAQHPDQTLIEALNIPPAKVSELIAEQVETLEDRLARVKLTDCAAQYQISSP